MGNELRGKMINPDKATSYTTQLYLLDTVVVFSTDSERYAYSWDGGGKILTESDQKLENGQWVGIADYSSTYDPDEKCLTSWYEQWQDGQLTSSSYRDTYEFYANGEMLTELVETWNGTQWTNDSLKTYSYDAAGNHIGILIQLWETGQWDNSFRYTYSYDSTDKNFAELMEQWDGVHWINNRRDFFSDSTDEKGDSIHTDVYQIPVDTSWGDTSWVNYSRYTYTYAPTGTLLGFVQAFWGTSGWFNTVTGSFLYTLTYDQQGNILTMLDQYWTSGQWTDLSLDTYTYDAVGHMLTDSEAVLMGGTQWTPRAKYVQTWDSNGNLLTWTFEPWGNSQWTNYERDTLGYDSDGNQILYLHQSWTGSSWLTSVGSGAYDYSEVLNINGYYFQYHGDKVTYSYSLTTVTAASSKSDKVPIEFYLSQNYPNPFNPTTTISYNLQKAGHVTLKVYDVLGREVATLFDGFKTAGSHTTSFDASALASGVYFYRIVAGQFVSTKKMLLMK
ncbi:MAG TPA: T9SS type A sorting domain-containing protein [Candidatus Kryptonia bacterium]